MRALTVALLFAVALTWACVWQISVYVDCSNMTGLWSMHCTNRYHDALEEAGLICGVCLEGTHSIRARVMLWVLQRRTDFLKFIVATTQVLRILP
jgi:hypothetical protein